MSSLSHYARGYIRKGSPAARSARRRSKHRIGPKPNRRQLTQIRRLYRSGYSNRQIRQVLAHPSVRTRSMVMQTSAGPKVIWVKTGGKPLTLRRIKSVTRKSSSRSVKARLQYQARLREKWKWKYGGKRLPPATHRTWGLLARITQDVKYGLRLEREGYSLP